MDLVDPHDRQERVCSACCNAGEVFAEETGRLIGKKNRGAVLGKCDDRARWTGRDAIIALCTPLKEQLFFHRTRGPQPVNTGRRRRRVRWKTIRVFDEFVRSLDGREDGIFQDVKEKDKENEEGRPSGTA